MIALKMAMSTVSMPMMAPKIGNSPTIPSKIMLMMMAKDHGQMVQ